MTVARRGLAADLGMPGRVPTQPVEIDWTHPLSNGLVACYVPGGAKGAVDLCGIGPAATFGTSGGIVPSSRGAALNSTGASQGAWSGTTPTAWKLGSVGTIFAAFELIGTPVSAATLFGLAYNTTQTTPFNCYILSFDSSARVNFGYNHAGTFASAAGTTAVGTGRHTAAATFQMSNLAPLVIYLDGAADKTTTWSGAAPSYAGGGMLQLAGDHAISTRYINGGFASGLIYNRILTPAEIAALDRDPFCMLRPIRSARFKPSGGTSVTVTPGKGSVLVTGEAPTASAGSSVTVGLGRITVNGKLATASGGATASPGKGSVLFSGKAPTASAGASVAPGKGTVTIAGFVPTVVTTSSTSVTVTPGLGLVAIRGYAPQIEQPEQPPQGGAADRRRKKKRKPVRVLRSLESLGDVLEAVPEPEPEPPAPQIEAPPLSGLMRRLDAERAVRDGIAAENAAETARRQAVAAALAAERERVAAAAKAEAERVAEIERVVAFAAAEAARYRAMHAAWDALVQQKRDEDEEEVEQLALGVW